MEKKNGLPNEWFRDSKSTNPKASGAKAVDISQTGELIVKTDDGTRSLSSADIHLIS